MSFTWEAWFALEIILGVEFDIMLLLPVLVRPMADADASPPLLLW